ncbi:MAG TPA: T9SS type A sorting domain-containing protein [Bacteroidetes bacterium]|nr:T9SS type A sorting domain-containing protein [Bacteroidota bacterium]
MKVRYFSILAFSFFILLTASTTVMKNANTALVLQGDPILPDEPFDYDISFPEHVIFGPWSSVDSSLVNELITPEGATLGRVLFYDKKLSASNELSCASCHKQAFAFADNKPFSDGINGATTARNSPNLNDLAWGSSFFIDIFGGGGALFWDARETDLERMVLQPIEHEGELGKDLAYLMEKLRNAEYYAPLFIDAFGSAEITPERVGSAIAQFVRSMSSFDSKFDQMMMGQASFTAQEQEGFNLFIESCGQFCHSDPHFGIAFPMRNGLDAEYEDIGVAEWTESDLDNGKFRSPSLRNIAVTAPYMHDGRFETLEEVVDFYSDGVFTDERNDFQWVTNDQDFSGFDFNDGQKAALVAFLNTLTDESFLTGPKWSDPFEPSTGSHFLPLEEEVLIYPNPMMDKATIRFDNARGDTYRLRLTSVDGRVLRSFKTASSTFVLEKEELNAGVYFLEIRKGNRQQIEKLVVQ